MIMGELRLRKSVIKKAVCAVLVASLIMPSFVLADEVKSSSIKVSPLKSFFSRFIKFEKKKPKETSEQNVTPANQLKGSVEFSMDDCIGFALKNDPTIKNYESTKQIQKSAIGVAKSSYFPTLFGSTGYYINNTKYSGDLDSSINNNYYGLNVGVNQLIWDFGYTQAKISMNKFNYEAAGYDLDNATLNSIYNVKIAYTGVLAARANEDICARSVKINELNVQRTKAMYDVGMKSKIDLVNANVYLTDAKILLLEAQNKYQSALIALNNAMYYVDAPDYSIKDTETFNFEKNYSVKNEINVSYDRKNYDPKSVEAEIKDGAILTSGIEKRDILKTYKFKPFAISLGDAIQQAYTNRPDLKSLTLVKKAADEALKAVKRSVMPAIGASGQYTLASKSDYTANAVGVFAGAQLPTVNAMSVKYQVEQGKSYLDISANNVDLLKKNIYFQVQNYYVNMKQLEKRIPLMSQKVAQTLENFELADGRYAVGLGNYLELQQAQTNYNNAQLAFVQAVFDYNMSRFYLEKSIGIK